MMMVSVSLCRVTKELSFTITIEVSINKRHRIQQDLRTEFTVPASFDLIPSFKTVI